MPANETAISQQERVYLLQLLNALNKDDTGFRARLVDKIGSFGMAYLATAQRVLEAECNDDE